MIGEVEVSRKAEIGTYVSYVGTRYVPATILLLVNRCGES
jgi:hypothetical protein